MRERKWALISDQGTAMLETELSDGEYSDPAARLQMEQYAPDDSAKPLQWADVTENDAFYDDMD
jgi:hypothetical protein